MDTATVCTSKPIAQFFWVFIQVCQQVSRRRFPFEADRMGIDDRQVLGLMVTGHDGGYGG